MWCYKTTQHRLRTQCLCHIRSPVGVVSQSGHDVTEDRREKMICRILLLITLTSCVCGTFVVNVTQSSYQAEENQNITLEWTFTIKKETPLTSLSIYCETYVDRKALFHLHEGVEVPESQDEQFAGRVQFDKEVLREGRIRLHVSKLRTDDSGLYLCEVKTNYGVSYGECRLNVTAVTDQHKPEPEPERERPDTGSWREIVLYCGLTAAAVFVAVCFFTLCLSKRFLCSPVLVLREVSAQQVDQRKQLNQQCNETILYPGHRKY